MKGEKVSVVLATFNEKQENLLDSINSVLNQSYTNLELIICIEPNEANKKLLFKLAKIDRRIRVFTNPNKLGFTKSLNRSISLSNGKYIARIDSDDIWKDDKLKLQISYLELNPEVSILGTDCELIDENGKKIGYRRYPKNIKLGFIFQSSLCHPSIIMKKEIIDNFGPYNEDFEMCEDLELWLRMLKNKIVLKNLNIDLIQYRVRENLIRGKTHWEYNYRSRKLHCFSIYDPFTASCSVFFPLILIGLQNTMLKLQNKIYRKITLNGK